MRAYPRPSSIPSPMPQGLIRCRILPPTDLKYMHDVTVACPPIMHALFMWAVLLACNQLRLIQHACMAEQAHISLDHLHSAVVELCTHAVCCRSPHPSFALTPLRFLHTMLLSPLAVAALAGKMHYALLVLNILLAGSLALLLPYLPHILPSMFSFIM